MASSIYNTLRWQLARSRALARDGGVCTVSRLGGVGVCSPGEPHVHHVRPLADGGEPYDVDNLATACASHHGIWEPLRRLLVERMLAPEPAPPRCLHRHVSAASRRECEARMARQRRRSVAA